MQAIAKAIWRDFMIPVHHSIRKMKELFADMREGRCIKCGELPEDRGELMCRRCWSEDQI